MSSSDWYLLWDDLARLTSEEQARRMERHRQNLTQVTGLLSYVQLAPLPLDYPPLFSGQLGLDQGGTNADLSGTGPGVLFQAASGADVTVGDLPFSFIDFSADAGAINQILVSDGAGGAFFSGVDLTSPNWRTGLLPPSAGGTGTNNSTRTLTVSTNSGTLAFSAASKVLTIGETIALTGTSTGFTLTVPATGTAALLGTAQTFSETNAFSKILRAHVTSGTTGYGLRFSDGSNDFGNFQALDGGGATSLFFSSNRYFDGTAWQQFNTRVGGNLQVTGGADLAYFSFATSSSTPVETFRTSAAGLLTTTYSDAGTNTAPNGALFRHATSGTPAAGFGTAHEIQLDSSTTANRTAATIVTTWPTATDASRKARRVHNIYDTAARETFREEASGTAPMLGFLGAAAVVRQVITGVSSGTPTAAQQAAVIRSMIAAQVANGLWTDSTT